MNLAPLSTSTDLVRKQDDNWEGWTHWEIVKQEEKKKGTHIVRAFTTSTNVPSIYIQLFWNSLTHDVKTGVYSLQVSEHWLTLSADLLWKALNVTPADSLTLRVTTSWYSNELGSLSELGSSHMLQQWLFVNLLHIPPEKHPSMLSKGKGSATDEQAARVALEQQ
ncbi:hypothetical protein Tco_0581484 [Tanacetum coccineum]